MAPVCGLLTLHVGDMRSAGNVASALSIAAEAALKKNCLSHLEKG